MPLLYLLISLAFIFALISFVSRTAVIVKLKRRAEKATAKKFKISFLDIFKNSANLRSQDTETNINIVFVRRKRARYHIEAADKITIYVANRAFYKTGRHRYSRGGIFSREKGSITLVQSKSEAPKQNFILFSRPPSDITTTDAGAENFLGNGDVVFKNTFIYSVNAFLRL